MNLTSPGVYVSEGPFQSRVRTVTLSSSVAAFFGTSDRGPTAPTLIRSWTEYLSVFGPLSTSHDLGYAVYHYFANGGVNAYVARVVGTGASKASVLVKYTTNNTTGSSATAASAGLFTATATSEGTWANANNNPAGVTVTVTQGLVEASTTQLPTFNVIIKYQGSEVERWTEVSTDPASSRYVTSVINNYSRYITVSGVATMTISDTIGFMIDYEASPAAPVEYSLSGGNTVAPTESNYIAALSQLDTIEGVLMINAVGQYTQNVVTAVMSKAIERGNSIAIIDPSPANTTAAQFKTQVEGQRVLNGANYSIFCAPMLTMVDPARSGPAAIRRTFPGGAVAGLYARTEAERTVGKTPAGYTADIRNALGVDVKFTETEIGTLYENGVNCFKQVPGAGVVLFGGRTMERLRPDRYISVRRSLNYLKQALKDATQFAVFEPNDERLWSSVAAACGNVLSRFWASGGLKGASQTDAYYVICDSTNNTTASVDNGEVRVEVGVALQQPAEYIVIQISQWTGGSNAVDNL